MTATYAPPPGLKPTAWNRSPGASAIGRRRTDCAAPSTSAMACALQLNAVRPAGPVTTAEPAAAAPGLAMMPDEEPAGDKRWMICSAERLETASSAPFGLIDRLQLDCETHSSSGATPVVVQPAPLCVQT